DFVAVPWRLVQQLEQVKAQPAVTEHRAHRPSPLSAAGCAATRLQSGTFALKHLTLTRYVALPESQDVSRVLLPRGTGSPVCLLSPRLVRPPVILRRPGGRARSRAGRPRPRTRVRCPRTPAAVRRASPG